MASLPAYLLVAALALICTQSQTVIHATPETAVAEQQAAPGPLLGQTPASASAQQTPATASAPVIAILLAPAPAPGGGSLPSVACGDVVIKTQVSGLYQQGMHTQMLSRSLSGHCCHPESLWCLWQAAPCRHRGATGCMSAGWEVSSTLQILCQHSAAQH